MGDEAVKIGLSIGAMGRVGRDVQEGVGDTLAGAGPRRIWRSRTALMRESGNALPLRFPIGRYGGKGRRCGHKDWGSSQANTTEIEGVGRPWGREQGSSSNGHEARTMRAGGRGGYSADPINGRDCKRRKQTGGPAEDL